MEDKKYRLLCAIRLWGVLQGMEEIPDKENYTYCADIVLKKDNKIYGFITEIDRDKEDIKLLIKNLDSKPDYLYVVTDDNAKRRDLIKFIPDYCGILCYGNSFGLGMIYQLLKAPTLIP